MLINILDISRKPEGTTQTRAIHFDTVEDVDLAEPVEGEAEITVVHTKLFSAHVRAEAVINRECDRCLKPYTYSLNLNFFADFADDEEDGDWPIVNNQIDLLPPLREEILLRIPLKSLCSPDCKGILDKTN
jgi:uncharacterized metal-binding protein YceD (DUF177 family)